MRGLLLSVAWQALNPLNPADSIGKKGLLLGRDVLLIVGIGLGLTLGLFFWARGYARRQKRRRHHVKPGILETKREPHTTDEPQRRHRRRRLRRDHRSRNPTLAETGGLPPARNESTDSTSPRLPG